MNKEALNVVDTFKMALEALENLINYDYNGNPDNEIDVAGVEAITAIKEALAVDKESLTTEARHMPSNDSLYKAWNLIGADLAGLKFEDFVRHLSAQQNAERVSNEQVDEPFDCWSTNDGDSWFEHPADAQLIYDVLGDEPKVGDEFEVLAGWTSVSAKYRVTEVKEDGDCEVECISHPPVPTAQPKKDKVK